MGDEGSHAESIVQIKERRFELDAVKFFAIFFMVMIHVYEYLGPYDTDHGICAEFLQVDITAVDRKNDRNGG